MSKLEAILSQEVEAEIRAILEGARKEAEGLLAEARAKAEALVSAREKAVKAAFQAALKRAESAGELLLSTARAQARGRCWTGCGPRWRRPSPPCPKTPAGPRS
jgi:V/A-type H+-transporting ATPase subunit E